MKGFIIVRETDYRLQLWQIIKINGKSLNIFC